MPRSESKLDELGRAMADGIRNPPKGHKLLDMERDEVPQLSDRPTSVHVFEDGTYFKALANKILVEYEPPAETTAGGLHIPATARQDMIGRATVLCYGIVRTKRGAERGMGISKGDRVLLVRALGEQDANPWIQKRLGKNVAVIRLDDIIGVET